MTSLGLNTSQPRRWQTLDAEGHLEIDVSLIPLLPKKDVMLLWNAVNWYFQEALYLHIFIWQRNDLCTPFLMHCSFIARKPVEKKFDHWQWISYICSIYLFFFFLNIHPTFKIFSVQETTNIKIKWWRKHETFWRACKKNRMWKMNS